MKYYNKTSGIIFILFFGAIIYSVYYIILVVTKVEGEAKLVVMNLPHETQDIKFGFDEANMEKLKWGKTFFIRGWVFKKNVKSEKRIVFIVLKSTDRSFIFRIEKSFLLRPDVTSVFHLTEGIDTHGFEICIPLFRIKEDTYNVGFVIEDETGKYYSCSKMELRFLKGDASVVDLRSNNEFLN